jgi:DNA-binding response OmpR family regulator
MVRPCFLVLDREHSSSISMRKLVIESAKFNVITAYSGVEALETFAMFPAVSGVVLDAAIRDKPCVEIVAELKRFAPKLPIIVVRGPGGPECDGADYYLDLFEPEALLELLRELQPKASEEIKRQNEKLNFEDD